MDLLHAVRKGLLLRFFVYWLWAFLAATFTVLNQCDVVFSFYQKKKKPARVKIGVFQLFF